MGDWKPDLYLKFEKQRTQPAIDLAARINIQSPGRILDISCGPGNSTAILKKRWPDAEIIGMDSSASMIEQAKSRDASISWICSDATDDIGSLGTFDIVFSNAAIQWMPSHEKLLPRFFSLLNKDGLLAIQVPDTSQMPIQRALQSLANSKKWGLQPKGPIHSAFSATYYYDILCSLSADVDLWETHYYHVMESHQAMVEWYGSTGLRPYLNAIDQDNETACFLADFEEALQAVYPKQKDGYVLFPFNRIFFIARHP